MFWTKRIKNKNEIYYNNRLCCQFCRVGLENQMTDINFEKHLDMIRSGFYPVPYEMEAKRVLEIARIYAEKPICWLVPVDVGMVELFGIPVKHNPNVKQLTLEVVR